MQRTLGRPAASLTWRLDLALLSLPHGHGPRLSGSRASLPGDGGSGMSLGFPLWAARKDTDKLECDWLRALPKEPEIQDQDTEEDNR